ncbi:MAG: hypothetical protein AB1568_01375 [Thermodesulfobacteriota bacterium]
MRPMLASLEDYLPLIVFVAFWLLSARRKKSGRQPPAEPEATERPTVSLPELLRQILLGGEVDLEPRPRRPPPRKPSPVAVATRPGPPRQGEYGAPGTLRPRAAIIPESRAAREVRPATAVPVPEPTVSTCRSFPTGRRRCDLRRAVIWSEILAPPLGLRD